MTVTTIFGSTADSDISSADPSYAAARGQVGGSTKATPVSSANELVVGQLLFGNYACYESFIAFDTSGIPDTDVISAVSLDLWLVTDNSTFDFTVRAREYDWGASVTTADFVAGPNLAITGNHLGDLASSGIGAAGAYKTFTTSAAIVTNWINAANMKTGTVRLILYSINQSNGDAPTGDERLIFSSADVAGTTQDPKLTVTHAAPTAFARPVFQRTTPRVWSMRGRT